MNIYGTSEPPVIEYLEGVITTAKQCGITLDKLIITQKEFVEFENYMKPCLMPNTMYIAETHYRGIPIEVTP